MPASLLLLMPLLARVQSAAAAPPAAGLHIYQTAPTPGGSLVLLDDARLDDALRAEAWPWGGVPPEETNSDRWKPFATQPMAMAVVRLLAADGHVLDEARLEQPLARLSRAEMAGLPPTWMVTEDFSVGMGSYNGPITSFLQVEGQKLRWVEATGGDRHGRLQVMESLKTAWKIDAARPTDLLHISCRPNEADLGTFSVTYERLHYENGVFHSHQRKVSDFWENESEESFPAGSAFPS